MNRSLIQNVAEFAGILSHKLDPNPRNFREFLGATVETPPENNRGANLKVEKVCRSCRRNRRGAAVVEFAVVAPVFILLVLGMLEMGRAIMVQQVIVNASREGARQAVLDGETVSSVQAKVREVLAAGAVPTSGATINVTIPNPRYNNPVSVQVSIPFSQVSWLPVPKYVNTNLTATSQMRCEAVQ